MHIANCVIQKSDIILRKLQRKLYIKFLDNFITIFILLVLLENKR